jgi:hypothetical protein
MATWVKETPTDEGWYWIRYRNKRKKTTQCPCHVSRFEDGAVLVVTAHNDTFMEGPNHGGPGLKYNGKPDKSIRFGPKIEEPD